MGGWKAVFTVAEGRTIEREKVWCVGGLWGKMKEIGIVERGKEDISGVCCGEATAREEGNGGSIWFWPKGKGAAERG